MQTSPNYWRSTQAVAKVTFLEIIHDKVLYNVLLFGLVMLTLGYLGAEMSFKSPERILIDFGTSAINLSSAFVAILCGATLLSREIDKRTIFVALARPISHTQFVVGKFAGLAGILLLNWLLLTTLLILTLKYFIASSVAPITPTFLISSILLFVQCLVLGGITLFFASFSSSAIAVICSAGLYLIGNNISPLRLFAAKTESALLANFLKGITALLPNFEHFNLGFKVTYGLPVSGSFIMISLSYAALLLAVSLGAAGYTLSRQRF